MQIKILTNIFIMYIRVWRKNFFGLDNKHEQWIYMLTICC